MQQTFVIKPFEVAKKALAFVLVFATISSVAFVKTAHAVDLPADCTVSVVSDSTTQVVGGSFAVPTYVHPFWTAVIPGATWIWESYHVAYLPQGKTVTFTKTFTVPAGTLGSSSIVIGADNRYSFTINGTSVGGDSSDINFMASTTDTYDVTPYIHNGSNTLTFTVTNIPWPDDGSSDPNPAGLLYRLDTHLKNSHCVPNNTAPSISLVGNTPVTIQVGTTYTDVGATATDLEDGNLTSSIVTTGTVNTAVPGTYTLTYTVTDAGGLSASTTRQVIVVPANTTSACSFVSDTSTQIVGGGNAVAAWSGNSYWTASIPGATWIWNSYKVADPLATTTVTFSKTFYATSTPTAATLSVAADNTYLVKVNGNIVASSTDIFNFMSGHERVYNIAPYVTSGVNTITFDVTNVTYPGVTTSEGNPAGLLYKVDIAGTGCGNTTPSNHPPVITLIGANPATTTVGTLFTDPGATATDIEDGNITNKIIVTGTVSTTTPGTYTLTYTVTDSGGLSASTTRQVVVSPIAIPDPFPVASSTCAIYSDTSTQIVGGGNAVAAWSGNSYWTASIPGATWIWNSYKVADPLATTTVTFSKTFYATSTPTAATLSIAADNAYTVTVNGVGIATSTDVFNGGSTHTYAIASALHGGLNTITFTVTNFGFSGATTDSNPAGLLYKIDVTGTGCGGVTPPTNHPPVITLIGANPATTTVGTLFTDPGATATDIEDGNITNKIIVTGTVSTTTPGTYTLTYTVTDSGGLSASTTRQVIVTPANNPNVPQMCTVVSDATNSVVGGSFAVPTYTHPLWTAVIPGATWIWNSYYAANPSATTTVVFTKQFSATSTPTTATLTVAADNTYVVKVNGNIVGTSTNPINFMSGTEDTYNVAPYITAGVNTLTFEVTNIGVATATSSTDNPAGLLYKLTMTGNGCDNGQNPTNHPPVITLIGANPATTTVGTLFTDPGATATDIEDGNITNKIIVTGTVSTTTPGTYTLTYTVTDSGGLSASTTRQVVVVPVNAPVFGKITFCLVAADANNTLATTSAGLPFGLFNFSLGTTTNISGTTIATQNWSTATFTPNRTLIGPGLDAHCQTVDNLPLGTYYYSQLAVNGALWNTPKYNDQYDHPINNVFDFFSYSGELFTATTSDDASRNMNSDGQVTLTAGNADKTVAFYAVYNPAPMCALPQITSGLSVGVTVNTTFNYQVTASTTAATTTTPVISVNVGQLPAGLTFSTTTNTISGVPTVTGTFSVTMTATNSCGTDTKTLTISVTPAPGGGGGGGTPLSGGGNGPIVGTYGGGGPIATTTPAAPKACYYLYDYLRKDFNNNPVEVRKLQAFLKTFEGETDLAVTGLYDDATIAAVDRFQNKYKGDILTPWGHTAPTDYVYILTKKKVNEIYCSTTFPVTADQQAEIDAHRAALEALLNQHNIAVPPTGPVGNENTNTGTTGTGTTGATTTQIVGPATGIFESTTSTTTLEQVGETTGSTSLAAAFGGVFSRLAAVALFGGKAVGDFLSRLFTFNWARTTATSTATICVAGWTFLGLGWFDWILILIILALLFFWYREWRNNRTIEDINKEIDLK